MLGIVLIYFIGKKFYDLAIKHEKKKWPNAILGVAVYYAGVIATGGIIGLYLGFTNTEAPNDIFIGLMCVPFGLLACWGLYQFKKKRFENGVAFDADSLDSDFLTNE